jgi:hypothetical protein
MPSPVPAPLDEGLPGSALSNAQVRESVARDRAHIARIESRVAASIALLEVRAADDPRGWSIPATGYSPARPEPPEVAAATLAAIRDAAT